MFESSYFANIFELDFQQLPNIVRFKSPAAHFKYWQNAHQPIWCSYGLYELKLALDLNGGMIFDETGTLLYSKKIVN